MKHKIKKKIIGVAWLKYWVYLFEIFWNKSVILRCISIAYFMVRYLTSIVTKTLLPHCLHFYDTLVTPSRRNSLKETSDAQRRVKEILRVFSFTLLTHSGCRESGCCWIHHTHLHITSPRQTTGGNGARPITARALIQSRGCFVCCPHTALLLPTTHNSTDTLMPRSHDIDRDGLGESNSKRERPEKFVVVNIFPRALL